MGRLNREQALRWMDDHAGRFVSVAVYVELAGNDSTRILDSMGKLGPRRRLRVLDRYQPGELEADYEEIVARLDEKSALYSVGEGGTIQFSDLEHLDVWTEEGWIDASTHNPVDLLDVRLAPPGVRLEVKYVAEDNTRGDHEHDDGPPSLSGGSFKSVGF